MTRGPASSAGRRVGRYWLFDEIASGGMATVYLGRLVGPGGFARTVAVKQLHRQYARDPEFASMFLDEGRLAAHVRHGNVVATVDVVTEGGELYLVMEYVHGASLAKLWRVAQERGERMAPALSATLMAGVLHGLHAAHEAVGDDGAPLGVVHRDVSPQNVLVGTDGLARVLDFGIAKAAWRIHTTRDGAIKGKLRYMAPEQLRGEPVDRRVDVFSAGVVLWELLTGRRLFDGTDPSILVARLQGGDIEEPRRIAPDVPPALDAVVMRALASSKDDRFATAREMALALESSGPLVAAREVGDWVKRLDGPALAQQRARVATVESFVEGDSDGGAAVEQGVGERIAAAVARRERAALATVPEETDTERDALVVSRRRGPLIAFGMVAGSVAFFVALLWNNREPTLASPVVAASDAAISAVDASPAADAGRDAALLDEPPGAGSLVVEAGVDVAREDGGAQVATSGSTGPLRPATGRPTRPRSAPTKPTPSAKGLCMKQRADGVVYFEPCP